MESIDKAYPNIDEKESEEGPGVKLTRELRDHGNSVSRIAWSPDGKIIAAGSRDDNIHPWDIGTSEQLLTLKGHADSIYSLA